MKTETADPIDPTLAVVELLRRALTTIVDIEERLKQGDHPKHVLNFIRLRNKKHAEEISEMLPSFKRRP